MLSAVTYSKATLCFRKYIFEKFGHLPKHVIFFQITLTLSVKCQQAYSYLLDLFSPFL